MKVRGEKNFQQKKRRRMLRVLVIENSAGTPLFEKVWKWSGVANPDGLSNMIRTFQRMSASIGDSGGWSNLIFLPNSSVGVSRVLFTENNNHSKTEQTVTSGKSSVKTNGKVTGSLKKNKEGNQQLISLICKSEEESTVGAFFEETADVI